MRVLLALAAVAAVSALDDVFVDKAAYLLNIAPLQLDRLAAFRSKHDHLTTQQHDYLDRAESFVRTFETDHIEAVEEECIKVFDKQQCQQILGGGDNALVDNPLAKIAGRGVPCSCSYLSDLCEGDNQYCLRGAYECGFNSQSPVSVIGGFIITASLTTNKHFNLDGCGALWAYQCNGICVPYTCVECG